MSEVYASAQVLTKRTFTRGVPRVQLTSGNRDSSRAAHAAAQEQDNERFPARKSSLGFDGARE